MTDEDIANDVYNVGLSPANNQMKFISCNSDMIGVRFVSDIDAFRLRVWIEIRDMKNYQLDLEYYIDNVVGNVFRNCKKIRVMCFVFWDPAKPAGYSASEKRVFNLDLDVIEYEANKHARPLAKLKFESLPFQSDILKVY